MADVELIQVVYSRAPTTIPAQDAAVNTWHLASVAGLDDTIRARVEGYFDTFFTAVKVHFSAYMTVSQYRWYQLNSSGKTTGAGAHRITPKAIVGTGTVPAPMPPQTSMTVTEKTPLRKRWGRFYLPIGAMSLTSSGRFSAAQVDIVADAAEILYNAVIDDANAMGFCSAVSLDGSFEYISAIQVDDLVDIQRRRRWDTPSFRDVRTLHAA